MRKILLTASVFAAGVLAYGAVGSGAWFTDTATVPVTATSATLDIEATGPHNTGFTVANLAPGTTSQPYKLHVTNTAVSLPVKYRITAAATGGDTTLFDLLDVEVRHGNCTPANPLGHDDTVGVVYTGSLSGLQVLSSQSVTWDLPTNWTHCYSLTLSLAPTVGNEAQSLETNFDIVIDATQPENPGWSESGAS